MIGKVIYRLVTHKLVIQCKDTFAEHFNPHQFGAVTLGKCKIMVHEAKVMLDLHLD
jgi:hypothetical protein